MQPKTQLLWKEHLTRDRFQRHIQEVTDTPDAAIQNSDSATITMTRDFFYLNQNWLRMECLAWVIIPIRDDIEKVLSVLEEHNPPWKRLVNLERQLLAMNPLTEELSRRVRCIRRDTDKYIESGGAAEDEAQYRNKSGGSILINQRFYRFRRRDPIHEELQSNGISLRLRIQRLLAILQNPQPHHKIREQLCEMSPCTKDLIQQRSKIRRKIQKSDRKAAEGDEEEEMGTLADTEISRGTRRQTQLLSRWFIDRYYDKMRAFCLDDIISLRLQIQGLLEHLLHLYPE